MPRDRSQTVRRRFLGMTGRRIERGNEQRQDVELHESLCHTITRMGNPSECHSCAMLDTTMHGSSWAVQGWSVAPGHCVDEQGFQNTEGACSLQELDVLQPIDFFKGSTITMRLPAAPWPILQWS